MTTDAPWNLPVLPPVLPMLAKRVDGLPKADDSAAGEWLFEPKWDGFRVLVFRDGDRILLQSRDTKPLGRYFPELEPMLKAALPHRAVVDGEIVLATASGLDFDLLSQRVHPAASRVKKLSLETPASVVLWDLLAEGDRDLRATPLVERRALLEAHVKTGVPGIHLTPLTRDRKIAADWFERFEGAGLDGVVAKRANGSYEPDKRVMLKIKHERTCECVVAGFRWHKDGEGTAVGSLLLGLYDSEGHLQHVGVVGAFTAARRKELIAELAPYRENALDDHPWASWASADPEGRMPGAKSRWSAGKNLTWQPLRPELVVEVAYEHLQGTRFRHTAQFRRWRTDKPPADCRFDQLETTPPYELQTIFTTSTS
jgi:ATP-dependent DNA ligase